MNVIARRYPNHRPDLQAREARRVAARTPEQEIPAMPDHDPHALLRELEQLLARAEEVRLRLAVALKVGPPPGPWPRPTITTAEPRYPDLTRTGRGLWAWAKEHARVDEVTRIGREARLPSRIVDWSPADVDLVVERLDADPEAEPPADPDPAPPRTAPRARRRRLEHPHRRPADAEPLEDDDIPY